MAHVYELFKNKVGVQNVTLLQVTGTWRAVEEAQLASAAPPPHRPGWPPLSHGPRCHTAPRPPQITEGGSADISP